MKFFKSSAVNLLIYLAVPAALACLVFIFTDNEAGRMASTYDSLNQKLSILEGQIENLTSAVATASEAPKMPPIPQPENAPMNKPSEDMSGAPALPAQSPSLATAKPIEIQDTVRLGAQAATNQNAHQENIQSIGQANSQVPGQAGNPTAVNSLAHKEENDINKIPLEFADQVFSPDDILGDKLNLVTQDFKVQGGLKKRVAFWFDVYTKYSSHFVLIHDSRHPWVVYRVVDLRDIYDQKTNRFVQDANDRRRVAKEKELVRSTLIKLAHKKNYQKLTEEEYRLFKLLEELPGPRRKIFNQAARAVREQRGQKDFYRQGLISSSRYLNEMEQIFASYDLPVELVRLPLVESSFNLDAQSKFGASGIWQFMLGTGKRYLRVGTLTDERNSPIKATEAAAKLMLSNFKTTHSWPLAITAYNHGAGGVVRACRRMHTTNIADLVNQYRSGSFSFASQNFFAEFLAALYGEKYQDRIFGPILKYPPLASESIDLKYSMKARTLTDLVGMTVEELKLYNPDLKAQAIAKATFLPVGYHIRLPLGRKARLELFYQQADEAKTIVGNTRMKNSRSQRHG